MPQSKERMPVRVLVVEDDADDVLITRRLLQKAIAIDPEVTWVSTYEEGLQAVQDAQHDVALVDYRLGPRTGLELLAETGGASSPTPIILLTGQGDHQVDLQAMAAGAADYMVKGQVDADSLERAVRYTLERRRVEEQLRDRKARLREQAMLLENANDAVMACDLEGNVSYSNRRAAVMTGWSVKDIQRKHIEDLLYARDTGTLDEVQRNVLIRREWSGELQLRTKSGPEKVVESRWTLVHDEDGNPTTLLVLNTDVTEQKTLETQFLRMQRMESIGRLVGGIAHDLGNLLVPIVLGVKVLQQRYGDDERAARTLKMMQQSAQRGSEMVKQVLAFARGVEGERVTVQPAEILDEVEQIIREIFPSNIEVTFSVDDDLGFVTGDATQLQQVLVNLSVNARDAMPEGGTLRIRATNATVSDMQAKMNLEASTGSYVRITVRDTGSGIPPDVLDKIFEPFFTTKEVGKGTGLGLSTVYSIVKSHAGFISVHSDVGSGTVFHVYLPRTDQAAPEEVPVETSQAQEGQGERILLVDDEPHLRSAVAEMLAEAHYFVDTAIDGQDALRQMAAQGDAIAAVITDISMPNMDGIALIEALRSRDFTLPIVATSGIADHHVDKILEAGANRFIAKPFSQEALLITLRQVLDGMTNVAKSTVADS